MFDPKNMLGFYPITDKTPNVVLKMKDKISKFTIIFLPSPAPPA